MNTQFEINRMLDDMVVPHPTQQAVTAGHALKSACQRLAEYQTGYRHIKRLLATAPGCPSAIEYAIENSHLHSDDWKSGARHAFKPSTSTYILNGSGRVTSAKDIIMPGNHTTYNC